MKKLMLIGGLVLVVCSGCQTFTKSEAPAAPAFVEVQVPHPGPVVVAVSADGGLFTPSVVEPLTNDLVRRGLRVGTKTAPDARMRVSTAWREVERLNDWAVWEGSATVRVTHEATGGTLLGAKTLSVKSARGTDEKTARTAVAASLASQLTPWLAETVTPKLEKQKVTERRPVPPTK